MSTSGSLGCILKVTCIMLYPPHGLKWLAACCAQWSICKWRGLCVLLAATVKSTFPLKCYTSPSIALPLQAKHPGWNDTTQCWNTVLGCYETDGWTGCSLGWHAYCNLVQSDHCTGCCSCKSTYARCKVQGAKLIDLLLGMNLWHRLVRSCAKCLGGLHTQPAVQPTSTPSWLNHNLISPLTLSMNKVHWTN